MNNQTIKPIILLSLALLSAPVFGQSVYKCQTPEGTPLYSQTPCGGQAITINATKPATGAVGIRGSERAYMDVADRELEAQKQANIVESHRQEALQVERSKANAAYAQAQAQLETARAILTTGRRHW